ncbi:MAG TPA: TRAP transporter large permease subunit [Burkholderiales bacterium]|nr:TRAP transporter large permease subunit [Burkholderiales bacterium]
MKLLLPASMLLVLGLALLTGLPVAVVLIATAFLFAGIALFTGAMRTEEVGAIFHRIYGTLSDRDEVVYAAVPMLLFMGAILHETGLAANLLSACARAFGRVRGGPALATLAVGAIQAPAAGMIGASTGALALYALPALRRHGYRSADAAGLVAAAGSLGAVAPPGLMLFFVADAIGVQVPALFLAMLAPLALLLALYLGFALARGSRPGGEEPGPAGLAGALLTVALMLGLVALVVMGLATLSEAAALAAVGAVLAGALHGRLSWRVLDAALRQTALLSAMVFFIFVGANVFSLVFRLLGGAEMVAAGASAVGSGSYAPLAAALALVFVLGMFLDWLEIVVIALPVLAATLLAAGVGRELGNAQLAGCWVGALFAIALQTSFLTPPFGYALFLVHGAARGEVSLAQVWQGALPYVVLQLLVVLAVAALPDLATWLPAQMLDLSIPKAPKFSD